MVLIIDNAPWHRGKPIDEALADNPHLEFKRLPSYSPQLNAIERFWKLLRRRATHNRLFESLADLKRSLRASLCYFQTVRGRIRRPGRQVLHPPRKPDSISGLVNQALASGRAGKRTGPGGPVPPGPDVTPAGFRPPGPGRGSARGLTRFRTYDVGVHRATRVHPDALR